MNEELYDTGNPSEIEEKVKKLLRLKERLRPIYFCRYSMNRNYSILYDPVKKRYYAKLYLMNAKNEKRRVSLINSHNTLIYISKNKKIFEKSSRKNCFLVFPLSFGSYQEEYLNRATKNPDMLRTARLIKKKDDYFLSLNISENVENKYEAQNYMGISRGIDSAVCYTIVDFGGKNLSEGYIDVQESPARESPVKDSEINRIANCLLKISEINKSQIIMENLQNSRDRLTYTDRDGRKYSPVLNLYNYNKLIDILNRKIQYIGLPEIIKVSAREIFYSCSSCGNTSKLNRFSENIMICTKCGMYNTIEKSGSLNLARKLIKYSNDKITINVEDTDNGLKFTNNDLGLEFYTQDPLNCTDEFYCEIDRLIKIFYENINMEAENKNFMKKLSMIKKIEKNKKVFELNKVD
jgi:putative transposase